ncbi:MAG: tetratricopeptide repeat protein [Myxococcales bacterium]
MKRLIVTVVVPTVVGCSSVGVHSETLLASEQRTRDAELTALRLQTEEQEQELRMVRSQLALARAELEELKANRAPSTRTDPAAKSDALPWARRHGDVPSVKELDGEVIDERLLTTAEVPDLPEFEEPPSTTAGVLAEPDPQPSVEGYRRALSLIRDERFEDALIELDAFLTAHPSHPYSDNALFWSGEIHFLRHEYSLALEYFERIDKLYPWGNKAPDALYRIGQIYLRRGDKSRARSYFDKVREQFPNTAAARLALREDAS